MSAMAGNAEDPVLMVLNHFQEHSVSKVVVAGEAGTGKTWVARKVYDSALKEGLFYGSIWIVPAENPVEKKLLDIIASQLPLFSCAEEWDNDEDSEEVRDNEDTETADLKQRILDKLDTMRTGKNQAAKAVKLTPGEAEEKKSIEHKQEVATRNLKYFLVVLDDITKEEEDRIVPELKRILRPNLLKMLITRKESRDSNTGATCKETGNTIQSDDAELVQLAPFRLADALSLFHERVKIEVSRNDKFKDIAKEGLFPAAIVLIAEALNHVSLEDGGRALENAIEEAANLKGDDITGVLRFTYELLPEGVHRSCYWISRQVFLCRDAVHFNELITYWILEGCFDKYNCIEKAYEEGHRVLMDLKDRAMLKGNSNYVYLERAMLKLPDERRNGFSGAMKLGLADVLSNGLGRLTLADGMIRTCRDKYKKELSTLVIDGRRLCKEVSEEFFKSMKGLKVLAVLNPMFESLPSSLTKLKDLQVLVLRGCQHLKEANRICELTNLSVLEISGASLLGNIHEEFFKDMANLKSINLSGLNTASLPASLFDQGEVRLLILRDCKALTGFPSLRNMKKLEMVDLCGCASFDKLSDGNISALSELKTLNVSGTIVRNLPILGKLGGLMRILLSDCPSLTMIRSLVAMTSLEVLDISGSKCIKDLNSAQLQNKPRFRILDLSETGIASMPTNISNLSYLRLKNCSDLPKLPSTKAFHDLVFLDLSGAVELVKIEDESFDHLKFLRHLDLSMTKIARLPSLSHLVELRKLLLKDCENLTELHGLTLLKKLEVLDLSGCCSLEVSPEESFNHMSHLEKLDISATKIEALPQDCFPSNLYHLILRDCKILKELPSLESLSKLEELNLCGADSLAKYKADFLHHMAELKVLNLSKTHLEDLPSLSHLKKLRELSLSGCSCVPLGLEELTELEVLDLSGTKIQSLPWLGNHRKLRVLLLSNCTDLDTLTDLESLLNLEVLDLAGTGITHFPDKVNRLTYLRKLRLTNVKQIQVDWSRIKYLPADFELDPCRLHQASATEITAAASTKSQSPSISVRGTGFFRFLKENSWLWDTCFKQFHFSVWLLDGTNGQIVELPGDMSLFEYVDPRRRFPSSKNCSLLEIHGSGVYPDELKSALGHAQYISVIDNAIISCISDLGEDNASSMERCWLERCPKLHSIFTGEEDIVFGQRLKSLYLCSLPSLERLCNEQLQSGTFSNLKDLHLDCCPMLVNIFSPSKLPPNLETLKVKFCIKLETLFGVAECEMPKLKTLEMLDLPALERIGAVMPALETLKVKMWDNLHDLCSGTSEQNTFSNLKTLHLDCCRKLVNIFSPSKCPVNLESLKVKSCNKLETLFKDDGSAECEMPKLQTLELFHLPALKRIDGAMPALEPSKRVIESCPHLQNGLPSSKMQAKIIE